MFRKRLHMPHKAVARNWGDYFTGHYVLGKNADRRALELIYHLDPFASLYACVRDSWC